MMNKKEKIILRNNVNIWGTGDQVMLFAHGFGCDQNMWRFVTPAFENNYTIVAFDYVGAGRSDPNAYNIERYSDLNGYALDILEICEALNLKGAIFVGHSVSAMIGLLAAIKEPSYFSDLIFIGPSPCYVNEQGYVGGFEKKDIEELLDTMDKNYIGWANFIAPAIMKNPERPELGKELSESFCSTDPVVAKQFAKATFFSDNRKDLRKVKIPTLILQCSDDLIAPTSVGDYMHSQMPTSYLKLLEATGHCPHMSCPEETIQAMIEYLKIRK